MEKDKAKVLVTVLTLLVVVLGMLVVYAFVLRPAMSGYIVKSQNDGAMALISYMVSQIQQQGYTQIPVGNQTLVLIPYQSPQSESAVVEN